MNHHPPVIRRLLPPPGTDGEAPPPEGQMPLSDHQTSPQFYSQSSFPASHVSELQLNFPEGRVQQTGVGDQGSISWNPNDPAHLPNFTDWDNHGINRGIENYAEPPQRNTYHLENHGHASQHPDLQDFSYKPSAQHSYPAQIALMGSPPYSETNASFAQTEHFTSQYAPFTNQFKDSQSASDFRKIATRFQRRPYRPPDADPTIEQIRRDRLHHVARIYNAMIRSDAAKDNGNSIAMRRWVHSAYYPAGLVEAYSHKILDCTLEQAESGFRGWNHNDYSQDERKGDDEDKHVNCATRLENIIRGLEEEKTICEDVMSSACQIRMFVNAPKAYAARKQANRVGNSKRGRNKPGADTETRGSPRGLKTRKTHFRNVASHRPAVSNANDNSPMQPYGTPPRHHASPLPAISSPLSRHVYPAFDLAVRSDINQVADARYQSPSQATMSPSPQTFPRFSSMPDASHIPFLSPPLPPQQYQSLNLPPSVDDQKTGNLGLSSSWPSSAGESVGDSTHQSLPHMNDCIDPILLQSYDSPRLASPPQYSEEVFQFDEPGFNLSGTSGEQITNTDPSALNDSFQSFWSSLDNVQQLPQLKTHTT